MRKTIRRNKLKNKTIRKRRGGAILSGYYHYSNKPISSARFKNISNQFIKKNLTEGNFNSEGNNNNNNGNNNGFSEMKMGMKPGGLWLSKGDEWAKASAFYGANYVYKATIDDTNMLKLDTIDKIKKFTETYRITIKNNPYFAPINWKKVAREYDGVIFDNYNEIKKDILKGFNPQYMWFSTLDINSACTWRPNKTIVGWERVIQ